MGHWRHGLGGKLWRVAGRLGSVKWRVAKSGGRMVDGTPSSKRRRRVIDDNFCFWLFLQQIGLCFEKMTTDISFRFSFATFNYH